MKLSAILKTIVASILVVTLARSQFIAYFNAKGLRGNFTFDKLENESLFIDAIVEHSGDDRVAANQTVLFDWSIEAGTVSLDGDCSSASSGGDPPAPGDALAALSKGRSIELNKRYNWTIALNHSSTGNNIGTLLWGKSVKLRLSQEHGLKSEPTPKPEILDRALASKKFSPAAIKPHLKSLLNITFVEPQKPAKHPFGTRPKPSIASRARPTAAPSSPKIKPIPFSQQARRKPVILVQPQSSAKPVAAESLILEKEETETTEKLQESTKKPEEPAKKPSFFAPRKPKETTKKPEQPSEHAEEPIKIPPEPTKKPEESIKKPEESIKKRFSDELNKQLIKVHGRRIVCSNILDTRSVSTVEAVFQSEVAGKVTLQGNEDGLTLIVANLYHVKSKLNSQHSWKILASDILDERRHEHECSYLEIVFDPNNQEDSGCKKGENQKCKIGDLTGKFGPISIAGLGRDTRFTAVDSNLPISFLDSHRALFMVVFEASTPVSEKPNILSCARLVRVEPRKVEALINMEGVRGYVTVSQSHYMKPSLVSYDLFGLEGNIKHYSIRELPLPPRTTTKNSDLCGVLGSVFNPRRVGPSTRDAKLTIDQIAIGNLSAKHGQLAAIDSDYEDRYVGEFVDSSIQLYGIRSIVGRSILISKNNDEPWVCATFHHIERSLITAEARFYFPVVGKITFQQLEDDPTSETGVLVELYSPFAEKNSEGIKWQVHVHPAMADFYNWSQRCEGSGDVFDPLQVSVDTSADSYNHQCQTGIEREPFRCQLGDVSAKSGFTLGLPLSRSDMKRLFYLDLFLPLSKVHSIISRSVVLYDDNAPKQRGNRLGCSTIKRVHPIKALVKYWDAEKTIPSDISGRIEFDQESPTRPTRMQVHLNGLNRNVEKYAIHAVWTRKDIDFPCSNHSLYDIYDPYTSEEADNLPLSAYYGISATVDRVKVGDLSRKHGTFEGLQSVEKSYLDANLPLFASKSIIGRSVILRTTNDFRFVCGNIEIDYEKRKARKFVAVASFDHPLSRINGSVKFTQVEHNDGSLSDTFVQIDLRLQQDGIHELQTSSGHQWAVYVNQVGADAFLDAAQVRCIASGFRWNPYMAMDSSEAYLQACSPTEPMGCAMGDLSRRHGTLSLGPNNRRVLSDENLPLIGNYSILGRSLIIFDNKQPSHKFACANIMLERT